MLGFLIGTSAAQTGSDSGWQVEFIGTGIKPAIALDGDGGLHVVFLTEAIPGALTYAIRQSGQWHVEEVAQGYFYGPVDLAVTDSGQPFIAVHDYQDDDFRLEIGDAIIATKNGPNWRITPVESEGHDGWSTALTLDEHGAWHLASIEPSQLELTTGLEYATNASGEIVVETVGSGPLPYDFPPSIAISRDGIVGISYFDAGQNALNFAQRRTDEWSLETVDAEGDVGRFSSLAFDANGEPHIAYFVWNSVATGSIRYARRDSDGWTVETVGELDDVALGFGRASQLVALALDDEDRAHIMYGKLNRIFYAQRGDSGWVVESALKRDTLGQHIDFALDDKGIPHLVFYVPLQERPPNGNVFYATP